MYLLVVHDAGAQKGNELIFIIIIVASTKYREDSVEMCDSVNIT